MQPTLSATYYFGDGDWRVAFHLVVLVVSIRAIILPNAPTVAAANRQMAWLELCITRFSLTTTTFESTYEGVVVFVECCLSFVFYHIAIISACVLVGMLLFVQATLAF